jgi:hypothetical protein
MTQTLEKRIKYPRAAREEHNLIAQAIARGQNLPDDEWLIGAGSSDRQLPPDANGTELRETYFLAMQNNRACRMAFIKGQFEAAKVFARVAEKFERQHQRIKREMTKEVLKQKNSSVTQYNDGVTYWIEMDGIKFYFDLDLAWDGFELVVTNKDFFERITHTLEPDAAIWQDLSAWIYRMDIGGKGRKLDGDDMLIWREVRDNLDLRENIAANYPKLVQALEMIRCTLRTERGL